MGKAIRNHFPILVICLLIAVAGVLGRVAPYMSNFAPIGAIALFAGAFISSRKWGVLLPIVAILSGDILLTFLQDYPLWTTSGTFALQRIFDIAALCVIFLLGTGLCTKRPLWKVGAFSIAGSLIFFILSNFGVWLLSMYRMDSGLNYEPTFAGLLYCYEMALPFFRGTFAGDLLYNSLFFGSVALFAPAFRSDALPNGTSTN